jgi:neopullulanase
VVANTANEALSANVEIDARTTGFDPLIGTCPAAIAAPGSVAIKLAPLDYMVCKVK